MTIDEIKNIFFFDRQSPKLIQFAQTLTGKLFFLFLFCGVLYLYERSWWKMRLGILPGWWSVVVVILIAMTFLSKYRRQLLFIGTIAGLTQIHWFDFQGIVNLIEKYKGMNTFNIQLLKIGSIISVLIFSSFYIFFAKKFAQTKMMKYPVANLIIFLFILIFIASYLVSGSNQIMLWSFSLVLSTYLWFICYSLLDVKSINMKNGWEQLSCYLPFWRSTNTPFPKGMNYLQKIEAKTSEELAISQIEGIKLLIWSQILFFLYHLVKLFIYHFNIPSLSDAFTHYALGQIYSCKNAWVCLISNFISDLLILCVYGHVIISVCRMAGFNAHRNTNKPLLSPTIAEFWNRYYYYFKELLVEFFFYPTYFKFFKSKPKLRIFFATLMAVCVGNVIYHFFVNINYSIHFGLFHALKDIYIYFLYGLILGTAIAISQIRTLERKRPVSKWWRLYVSPFVVTGFYAMMTIFNTPYATLNIKVNFSFLLSLFKL